MIYGARPSTLWHKAAAPFVALARATQSAALSSDKSAITAAVLRLIISVNNGHRTGCCANKPTGRRFVCSTRAEWRLWILCVMEFDDGAKPLCLNLRQRLRRSTALLSVFWLLFLISLVCQKRAKDYSNGFLMVFVFNFKSSCASIFVKMRPVFFLSHSGGDFSPLFRETRKFCVLNFASVNYSGGRSLVVLVCVRCRNPCAHSLYTTLHNHLKYYTQALVRAIITLLIKSLVRDNWKLRRKSY